MFGWVSPNQSGFMGICQFRGQIFLCQLKGQKMDVVRRTKPDSKGFYNMNRRDNFLIGFNSYCLKALPRIQDNYFSPGWF